VKYRGMEFSFDELTAFRTAMEDSPTARLLTMAVAGIRNEAKLDLQRPSLSLDEIRNRQGAIEGLNKFKDVVRDLLTFDVDELLASEVEQSDVVEEEENDALFDF
jgi:hypothetical protein